ncbi:hypothetical protein GPA22_03865 [Aromatoleum toluvorans]|uniref:Uncharacterized protein n=1 Tax=Aromatoleum toluvorans TaxID=92002 RepID=A0ABX1PTU6_9RHOO|nr:hypothetical protein [Aromatoleum toluvorans]NMG42873.1 hypothetical protein [Aromatoleum toluvorans]
MARVHIKGYILQLIAQAEGIWDNEIATAVCAEYGKDGAYWHGTVRVILTDLYSGGLVKSLEERFDAYGDKMRFRFALSDFGRQRMADTGLL